MKYNLRVTVLAIAFGAFASAALVGCSPSNPNAQNIDAPIVTSESPKSSEEAAERSEPPPVEYRTKKKSR